MQDNSWAAKLVWKFNEHYFASYDENTYARLAKFVSFVCSILDNSYIIYRKRGHVWVQTCTMAICSLICWHFVLATRTKLTRARTLNSQFAHSQSLTMLVKSDVYLAIKRNGFSCCQVIIGQCEQFSHSHSNPLRRKLIYLTYDKISDSKR